MLLLLRRLKHVRFMSNEFRKYLSYAVGEMLLVVLGILIALQIDNWNDDRKEAATLQNYLQTIARNMRDDMREVENLRALRSARILDASNTANFLAGARKKTFTLDEIYFFNKVTTVLSDTLAFRVDNSGFQALRSSGVIDRLQGQDIERVLSKYYDQVSNIEDLEMQLNQAMNSAASQYQASIPYDVSNWAFSDPRALPEGLFEELQPVYARVINGSGVREMLRLGFGSIRIVREYDRLLQVGDAFIEMVDTGRMSLGSEDEGLFFETDATEDPEYYAQLVVDGQIAVQTYYATGAADGFEPIFDFRAIEKKGDALHIEYPGSKSWAAIFLVYMGVDIDRPSRDFSDFDKLSLELRGDRGDEVVSVSIKDRYLPDYEAPDSVQLRLSDEWQTYEIDLADFPNTDVTALITPLSFIFVREPQSFWLRNARFVRAD